MSSLDACPSINANADARQPQQLGLFDATFKNPTPFFYFTHLIDGAAATLTIQVLGPDLTYTFTHSRAQAVLGASRIAAALQRKTVGFLALLEGEMADEGDASGKRVVLAWAESGHGAGKFGDLLDRQDSVLPNRLWTRRVVAVGDLLGIKMARMFDRGRRGPAVAGEADRRGIFQGSHVEVKLAVHAVYMLLRIFDITDDLDAVTAGHLRRLRDVRWENGSRPAFEVYFSRKNCHPCGNLVARLSALTGISIKLLWKDRLVPVVYHKPNPNPQRRQQRQPSVEIIEAENIAVDDQDVDFGDEDADEDGDEDGDGDEVMSISDDSTINGQDEATAEVIDLTDATSLAGRGSTAQPADRYLDGLAYCVGQIDLSAEGAQRAIVEFAGAMLRYLRRRGEVDVGVVEEAVSVAHGLQPRRRVGQIQTSAGVRISKPLPATAETEAPAWMRCSASASSIFGSEQQSRLLPRIHPLQTQKRSNMRQPELDPTKSRRRTRSSSPKKRHETDKSFRDRSPRRYHSGKEPALEGLGVPLSRWNFT